MDSYVLLLFFGLFWRFSKKSLSNRKFLQYLCEADRARHARPSTVFVMWMLKYRQTSKVYSYSYQLVLFEDQIMRINCITISKFIKMPNYPKVATVTRRIRAYQSGASSGTISITADWMAS